MPGLKESDMRLESLISAQRRAIARLTDEHVKPEHKRRDIRISPSWVDKSIYVTVRGRLDPESEEYGNATAAERFAVSGFHANIGPRGGVKLFK
jgi:hypothetical protein